MQVIHLSYPFQHREYPSQVLAIGDFDGVHFGHQKVIGEAVSLARREGVASAIMTFHPHPREILGQAKYEYLLTPFAHKLQLISELNVDYVYVITFDPVFAQVSAESFIEMTLQPMNLHTVVVGFDFTFGHMGRGNSNFLKNYPLKSFDVLIIEPHQLAERKISSTRIRELLENGSVEQVPQLLGRYYDLIGMVRHGDGRGRTIGFPTANLELDGSYIFPKLGVYAVYAYVKNMRYKAIVNIGVRPTFRIDPPTANVEVHLLDFDGNLYDCQMKIELFSFIREEVRFAGVDELIDQIKRDIESVRALFLES